MLRNRRNIIIAVAIIIVVGLCLVASFTALGSGLAFWFVLDRTAVQQPSPTSRPTRRFVPTPTPTGTPTATPIPTASPTAKPSATPIPTATQTSPPPTATSTATATSSPTQPLPTATPPPTATPAPPAYAFTIKEKESFGTNHLDFDVYVAVTNSDNKPVSGYRLLGHHSNGLQIESEPSAGDWTVNSGAMHYKAGNLKYQAPNSASGVWTLQLVDDAGSPAAPPVEFPFDADNPTWYFLLYRRQK